MISAIKKFFTPKPKKIIHGIDFAGDDFTYLKFDDLMADGDRYYRPWDDVWRDVPTVLFGAPVGVLMVRRVL